MSQLRFAVLGPVRAHRGDTELDLGSPQQRAVLAVLLLAEGKHVALGALIDALWGDEPPRAASGTVRTYVSRLRRCLRDTEHDVIESAGDGYVLRLEPAELDLNGFLRLTSDARTARNAGAADQAALLFEAALAKWQGVPLAGIPGEYAASQRVRLAEFQLAALGERLALNIELGAHVAAAAELQALLAAHPMRERLAELLMLALYRSGRQADALTVYGQSRRLLRDELGIDPGPAMQEMHQRILQMDTSLIPAPTPPPPPASPQAPLPAPLVRPAQLPADLPAFTGRCAELAQLNASLDDGKPRSAAVLIHAIDGTAGIGKSALAVHWAHLVADRFPDGQLYVNLRGFDPSGSVTTPGEALHGFLDALAIAPQRIPDDLPSRAGLYRSLLHDHRVLIVLDNARDAGQIRPLLPGSPGCLVIATSRNQLTGLITTHDARPLTLDRFSAAEARDALSRRLGPGRLAAEPEALAEIIELCAGLPLATAIVAARATVFRDRSLALIAGELRDARTRLDALSADDTTTDVRAVFSWSYQLLSAPAGQLFRLLSVHNGPDFSRGAAASLAGLPAQEVRPLLSELTGARLITEHRPGRFSSHDLIRIYAAELSAAVDTDDDRSSALGRLVDYYLHTAHAAHMLLQPQFVPPTPTAARPGVTPEDLPDYTQAMAWLSAERRALKCAVSTAADDGFPRHAWQLALTMQQFYQRQGYWYDWAATMLTALGAAESAGDLDGQAHAHRSLAGAYHFLGRDEEALAELERTRELFTELGYTTEHAYLHSNFGTILASQRHYDEAIEHYWQAYELYQAIGHEKGQGAALEGIGKCHGQQGRYEAAVQYVDEAMTVYQQLSDSNGEANCWASLGEFRHQLGEYREAMNCQLRAVTLCRQLGNRTDEAEGLIAFGDSALAAGDRAAARDAWGKSLIILDELRLPQAQPVRTRLAGLDERSQAPAVSPVP
ncbi:MAG TPA: BTAD domain-containing putative transcriptional regulator [Streptosporangiaceae bacterium]